MKIIFEGKERQIILPKQPVPKVFQVWEHVNTGRLITVYNLHKVNREIVTVYMEDEKGDRFSLGCGWLNGIDYKFIGLLF